MVRRLFVARSRRRDRRGGSGREWKRWQRDDQVRRLPDPKQGRRDLLRVPQVRRLARVVGSAAWPGADETRKTRARQKKDGRGRRRRRARSRRRTSGGLEEDEPPETSPTVGQLVCASCGTGNWPHALFCRRCGAVLQGSAVRCFLHACRSWPRSCSRAGWSRSSSASAPGWRSDRRGSSAPWCS